MNELSDSIAKKTEEMEQLFCTAIAELEEMEELEEMIEDRKLQEASAESLSGQDLDTITLTVSEAPLSPTINDDIEVPAVPDILATDNISQLLTSPHPNVHVEPVTEIDNEQFDPISTTKNVNSGKKVHNEEEYEEVATSRRLIRQIVHLFVEHSKTYRWSTLQNQYCLLPPLIQRQRLVLTLLAMSTSCSLAMTIPLQTMKMKMTSFLSLHLQVGLPQVHIIVN